MAGVLKAGDSTVIQVKCDGIVVCLFLRSNSSSGDESDQNDQSLFVRGVPLYWPEETLKQILARCGKIKSCIRVKKADKPELSGYKLTFKKKEDIDKALNIPFSNVLQGTLPETLKEELPELYKEYVLPRLDPKKVIADVDEFLKQYLKEQEQREKKEQELSQPDDEGWVTVTKQSKMKIKTKGNFRRRKHLKKKNAEKELLKLYSCQEQEEKKKMVRMEQMQVEKSRRQEMKLQRKFRPY